MQSTIHNNLFEKKIDHGKVDLVCDMLTTADQTDIGKP